MFIEEGCIISVNESFCATWRGIGIGRWLELSGLCILFGAALCYSKAPGVASFPLTVHKAVASPQPTETADPEFGVRFASSSFHRHVHSASIAPLPNGGLIAVWFAGSREGAHDVNIRSARFDGETRQWGEESKLISRATTETLLQRNIRKLGNPVVALAPDDRLWLFYVSVSLGGWAGSSINAMYSDTGGDSWSSPKRLITSPFLNISTLVRNPPVFHRDGSIGLPIYHEFLGKFAEYLYLGPEGQIIDKFRISSGDYSLQPAVVPTGENSAIAFMRNAGMAHGKVIVSFTRDRGETWSELQPSKLWNPNSAVSAVGEGNADGDILVALNDLRDGRFRLSLYQTDEQLKHWHQLSVLDQSAVAAENVDLKLFQQGIENKYMTVAQGDAGQQSRLKSLMEEVQERACDIDRGCESKYEYPTIIRSRDGYYHVVYSWNNTLIKHAFFNSAWLEEQT